MKDMDKPIREDAAWAMLESGQRSREWWAWGGLGGLVPMGFWLMLANAGVLQYVRGAMSMSTDDYGPETRLKVYMEPRPQMSSVTGAVLPSGGRG